MKVVEELEQVGAVEGPARRHQRRRRSLHSQQRSDVGSPWWSFMGHRVGWGTGERNIKDLNINLHLKREKSN